MAPTVDQLSREEKAALVCGRDFWTTTPVERLQVPSIVLTDGPHGVRRQSGDSDHLGLGESRPATCFPLAVAVGSSWSPEVAEKVGAAIGLEARALGVHVVLGPGVNIKRSPLCGRNFEYYSEDPLLAGTLGAAHVRGQQAQGVGASVKHFAANNQETDRMRISADVDPRTLREIYLPTFEHVIRDAGPATVMCSYNRINGVPSSENRWLLTDVLREQWGFTGAVVSDWGAVSDPVAATRAGLDLQMPGTGGRSVRQIVEAVQAGTLSEEALDAAAARVLALTELAKEPSSEFDAAEHHSLARELATECAVLLKNDREVLPLDPRARIAVIGEFARTPRFQGGGSSHVNANRVDAALDFLCEQSGGTVDFAAGFTVDGTGDAAALRAEAVATARNADVAVVFAGLADADESEGYDRVGLELPSTQRELITAVSAAAPKTVVVLANGGVVTVDGWHDDVDAILEGFLLGQAGGSALADLLFGGANPSGRLAESIPVKLADTASYLNFPGEQGHVRYGEGVMVGYRWHETAGVAAHYPFGHGLSYTTFEVTDLAVDVTGPDTAHLKLTVTNTGRRRGGYVVQVYVATTAGPVQRPVRELRFFTKVHLDPGETRSLATVLGRRAFAYWDIDRDDWVVAPGDYTVQVCRDSATVSLEQTVTLEGDKLIPELTFDSTMQEWFSHPVAGQELLNALASGAAQVPHGAQPSGDMMRLVAAMPMRTVITMLGDAAPVDALEELMARSRGR
ncbi:glycoside hydrolase family 3 C-terminal domain-containing protein [Mycolicibacterium sp. BiH015]|uniref:glycoside hydrolase family 3 C-terminal domain-containing protein n=1 Tax=Mycolicibacterium sp. BiH015 TaxID=3018808 RepID=UPI0022E8B90E|nr:glycoside hydrolase family 3 C-terminal domain-containing protein [Mycolicibacterium sp. BiH015]MDA2892192.1 glycoside hydrolase family 3 C-terminal domain-containing protein [Mycolicibacterium sp. BiH015]